MARRQKVDEEEHNYWMSYSDMMAALFLVFILIISFTLVQYEHAKNELFAQNEQRERDRQKLEEQNRELKASEKTIEDVIGIKAKIIEKLKERFDKKDIKIKVDNTTGAIELDSSILFDVDKSELKIEGKNKLRTVLPEYIDALFEYENEISEIIIEGHTDNDGVVDTETITTTFVAYAPYDNPRVSFTVISPDVYYNQNGSTYQSNVNKRIVSRVSKKYFDFYK